VLGRKLRFRNIFCIFILWLLSGCQNKYLHTQTQVLMGTFVEVVSPDERCADIVFSEIKRVEGLLSKYNPESEISMLNRSGNLRVSEDTYYILKKAREFWLLTEGAFDISVGPLLDLWGFTDKKYRLPTKEEINLTMERVGFDKIILYDNGNMIQFKVQDMRLDLGAIAKGYAVDCAIKKIKENGIKSCLINAGGDIYCLGDKFGRPWSVAIKNPRKRGFLKYLRLIDKAVATSGDYEQYFFKGGRRYTHIFNPKTGYPEDSGVVSATVIAQDCLTADALATSILVLGKDKGLALVKKFPGAQAIIVDSQ